MKEPSATPGKNLNVAGLKKKYGDVTAVEDLSFEVTSGSLTTLLGPSGCGKTTTLRMIGGLIAPSVGRISLDDRDITSLPPWQRNCGFVFQSYALFPHMNIRDNIAYGLKLRGWPRRRIEEKVAEVAKFMDIAELLDRVPPNLSGGQQQRSAVARALAIEPDILLMDEPLANLDAQLRDRIRFEIRRMQSDLGITIVYVTHDQSEAFAISDEILVMKSGELVQKGSPQEIFSRPVDPFVASFVGVNNLLYGHVLAAWQGSLEMQWGGFRLRGEGARDVATGDRVIAVVGAHNLALAEPASGRPGQANHISGELVDLSFMGSHYRLLLQAPAGTVTADLEQERVERSGLSRGDELNFEITSAYVIPDTE